ncbi:MAG TPA: D-TA family PLP-dependent enzyme [Polyangiaceae bacterium]|jgi:D-serine deaminase-like pyridoxal phosphate-dependent protein|nr:D-TA family PLP-dependent enzyme [Polyangiaceae bacterium]
MSWFELENAAEIPSPSLLIYSDRVRENLTQMCRIAGDPARLRPHVKTHKLPQIVQMSLELGIRRFKCATLAEAEMLAQAAAPDALLACQPVGPNVARLKELSDAYPNTRFSCLLDDEEAALELSAAFAGSERALGAWLDIDVGMERTGVSDPDEAQALYALLSELPGLFVRGLHAYDGHVQAHDLTTRTAQADAAFAKLDALTAELKRTGFPVEQRIIGGSPSFSIHAKRQGIELSAGTSVLWDHGYGESFADLGFLPAALVLTRVVSKPGENRLCLDLGHKAIGSEMPPPRVHLLGLVEVVFIKHSEEHLVIETPSASELSVGSLLYGVPWHVCPTVALYDKALVVHGKRATEAWPITRGRSLRGEKF